MRNNKEIAEFIFASEFDFETLPEDSELFKFISKSTPRLGENPGLPYENAALHSAKYSIYYNLINLEIFYPAYDIDHFERKLFELTTDEINLLNKHFGFFSTLMIADDDYDDFFVTTNKVPEKILCETVYFMIAFFMKELYESTCSKISIHLYYGVPVKKWKKYLSMGEMDDENDFYFTIRQIFERGIL